MGQVAHSMKPSPRLLRSACNLTSVRVPPCWSNTTSVLLSVLVCRALDHGGLIELVRMFMYGRRNVKMYSTYVLTYIFCLLFPLYRLPQAVGRTWEVPSAIQTRVHPTGAYIHSYIHTYIRTCIIIAPSLQCASLCVGKYITCVRMYAYAYVKCPLSV